MAVWVTVKCPECGRTQAVREGQEALCYPFTWDRQRQKHESGKTRVMEEI